MTVEPPGLKRKLTAILNADVKGYSRLMGDDEAATVRTINAYRDLMAELIQRHRGRMVDFTGDNLLAEFASVVDAVQCAVRIQETLGERNAELPEHRRMHFRIGINLGDVIVDGDRIYGDGVNVAARVQTLADGGGICLSGAAYDQIKNKLFLAYQSLGEHAVKNIAEPVRVYRLRLEPGRPDRGTKQAGRRVTRRALLIALALVVVAAGVGAAFWRVSSRPPAPPGLELPDKPSIAVLPFVNVSGDPKQEPFSDGMTEEIITTLTKVSGLFVIASNSVFAYKGKPVKVQQVSRDLGVRYVLEGSVRRSDLRIRVTAQLVDATTGHHLWAERYDREFRDVFALQDEITQKIVTALAVRLTEGEQVRFRRQSTRSVEAWESFTQGQEQQRRGQTAQARVSFEKAIALDPKFAAAYAHLSSVHSSDAWWNLSADREHSLDVAFGLAQRAVALDETLADGHIALAWAHLVGRQHSEAIAEAERAVALNPGHADATATLGMVLMYSGRLDESIGLMKSAMRLSPVYPAWYLRILGISYGLSRRPDEALVIHEKRRDLEPESWVPYFSIALTYVQMGRDVEARAAMADAVRLNPKLTLESFAKLQKYEPYKDPEVVERLVDVAGKAGLK